METIIACPLPHLRDLKASSFSFSIYLVSLTVALKIGQNDSNLNISARGRPMLTKYLLKFSGILFLSLISI